MKANQRRPKKKPKREYGTGGVYERTDRPGVLVGQIRYQGKRYTVTAKSKAELKQRQEKLVTSLHRAEIPPGEFPKVEEYLEWWLRSSARDVRPRTHDSYVLNVARVQRVGGSYRLDQLDRSTIRRLYDDLAASGGRGGRPLSKRSVQQCHAVFHKALEEAVQQQILPRNPTAGVPPPAPEPRPFKTLEIVQLSALLAATQGHNYGALWAILGTTGMRLGEALALTWGDIDFKAPRVTVNKALQRQRASKYVAERKSTLVAAVPTKTRYSRRGILLTTAAISALEAQRELQKVGGNSTAPGALIFTTPGGGMVEPGKVTSLFHSALERADLEKIRVHDLRHTVATLLLKAGEHPKVVQEILGHSSIAITLDLYSHVAPGMHDQAISRLDQALRDAQPDREGADD